MIILLQEVSAMEQRKARLIVGKAGGTASENSRTYKISLPTTWIKEMNIEGKDVELSFDGHSITISPSMSLEKFVKLKKAKNHRVYKFSFYNMDKLCTVFYADFTDETVKAENYTDELIKTAFGSNTAPTWEDFDAFLRERCISRERDGLMEYLESIGLYEYDPFEIVKKTQGRMAEDKQWLEIEEI